MPKQFLFGMTTYVYHSDKKLKKKLSVGEAGNNIAVSFSGDITASHCDFYVKLMFVRKFPKMISEFSYFDSNRELARRYCDNYV